MSYERLDSRTEKAEAKKGIKPHNPYTEEQLLQRDILEAMTYEDRTAFIQSWEAISHPPEWQTNREWRRLTIEEEKKAEEENIKNAPPELVEAFNKSWKDALDRIGETRLKEIYSNHGRTYKPRKPKIA